MSTYFKALSCLLTVMAVSSCVASMEQEAEEIPEEKSISLEGNYDTVTMSAGDFVWETLQTKTTLTDAGAFYWREDDIVGIIPDEGTQVKFPIDAEEGSQAKTAEFNGGAWALKKNSSYMAYYPFISDMDLDKTQVPVDFSNQCQQGIGTTNHLSTFDFMAASGEMPENDNINFNFEHLSSLLRLNLTIPKVGDYKTLTLHCDDIPFITEGTVDLTQDTPSITATSWSNDFVVTLSDFSTTEANQTVTIYLLIPPIDMSGQRIHVRLTGDHADCETYYDRPDNKPFLPGHAYSLTMNDMAGGDVIKLIDGESFNAAIKCLANGPGFLYTDNEYSIRHVVFETQNATIPNVSYVDVSDPQSETNIYAWWNSETKTLGIRTSALRVFANEDAHGMFSGLCHLEDIDFTGMDFGYSTDVSDFLNDCYYLTTVNGMSAWGSASNVENYSGLFKGCKQLAAVDISQLNTSSCVDINSMFEHCEALTSVDLSTFNTTNLEQMYSLFAWCTSLESVDFGDNFDCSKVTRFADLFSQCGKLTNLDITGLNMDNGVDFSSMFENCGLLTTLGRSIPIDYGDQFSRIFMGCSSLTNASLAQAIEGWDVSGSGNFGEVFSYCTITDLDLHTWNVQKAGNFYGFLWGCSNLSNLNITGWQTDNVDNMQMMFGGCSSLVSLDLSSFVTDNVVHFERMFAGCSALETLTLTGWNTGKGMYFSEMFLDCTSLGSLNVKQFDVSKATDLSNMFNGCTSLTTIDISGFDTSSVEKMNAMFSGCTSLASVDISGIDVSNARNLSWMFYDCQELTNITGISSLNPVLCADFFSMFGNCYSLTALDLSAWNTPQAERMYGMFSECHSLSSLDITNFNTTNLTNDEDLVDFVEGCLKLETFKTGANFAFKGFNNHRMSTEVESCTIYCTPEFKQAWLDANLDGSNIVWMNYSTFEPM